MFQDRLQLQRFELKYIISESIALAVRNFVSAYLALDEHGVGCPQSAYPVHSLYLDSRTLSLYGHTVSGHKNRFKLRLRFYSDQPEAPVFFEIKRRVNEAILKQRAAVRRAAVSHCLNGLLADESDLFAPDPHSLAALQRFLELRSQVHAHPIAHVAYRREAWIHPEENSVRVTLDRDVCFEPENSACLGMAMKSPIQLFERKVILEIKFTGRFPHWFGELVRAFELTRCSAAKYADGVTLLGENRLVDSAVGVQA